MSTTPKTIHSEDKIRDALRRLVDGVWRGGDRSTRSAVHESVAPCFSIPADYDRDADLIVAVAIDELMRLRSMAEALRLYRESVMAKRALETSGEVVRHPSKTIELEILAKLKRERGEAMFALLDAIGDS